MMTQAFAELRARATQEKHDAKEAIRYAKEKGWAYHEGVAMGEYRMAAKMLVWLDDQSGSDDKSFDTTASSASKDDAAPKPSVPCTAVHQIAQWLAEVESMLARYEDPDDKYVRGRYDGWLEDKTRIRAIMDAINAS